MSYKHAEVVKAWLDGKEIQVKSPNEAEWHTVRPDSSRATVVPAFTTFYDYRIKPDPDPVVPYKRYILRNVNGKVGVGVMWKGDDDVVAYYGVANFIRWIDTDWQVEEL